ncbi:unnamed protein product [Adineta ricciae]|uniref:G-protein coupled receptors family 1 profile domain-containing protein n=1 Tax=Adineta ricciae TaxID=249248 RepID=A0A815I1I6_ADIRI|nr:unnamed protein product [Adineta ricciae]
MTEDDVKSPVLDAEFWIMIILLSVSIPCSISIFIYFYRQRKKIAIQHHLTLVLVTLCFMDMVINYPIALVQNRRQRVISATASFCLLWNWWAYSLITTLIWVAAYGSIERYLLVFHNGLFLTRRKRIFLHFLPILTAIIYSYTFYFVVIVLHSCEDRWDYNSLLCRLPCYVYSQPTASLYDFVVNTFIPLTIITVANVVLIVRVLWQKRKRQRDWKRKWKLSAYLILLAVFFMITWCPGTINSLIYLYTLSPVSENLQMKYFFFLPSLLEMILSIISVFFLPDFTKTVFRFRRRTVKPHIVNH